MRVISVSQIASLDTMIVYLCQDDKKRITEITQPDHDGMKWTNRGYYIGKELREIDGQFVVIN